MSWIERYFFTPNLAQKILAILLLPFSALYAIIAILNAKFRKKVKFEIPIISVGNLTLGGNGKTPVCKAIARLFSKEKRVFIVLRGYKRKSKGLKIVKYGGEILCNVDESGDEAMEFALNSDISGVIVSEDRVKAINTAISLYANIVILDDAFGKFHIKKFDILLESALKPYFSFVLPSGAYRLPKFFAKNADFVAVENTHFTRHSRAEDAKNALLLSAIAKPFRLYEHFGKAKSCAFFADHHKFTREEVQKLLKERECEALLLTMKDFVKVREFGFKCHIIELEIELSSEFKRAILNYVEGFYAIS